MSTDPRPRLGATAAPLLAGDGGVGLREALAWLSQARYRGVQLSATDPATRPRELDRSARRDLASTLVRHELACTGLDFLIPPVHYLEPSHQQRALDALCAAIDLGADLGGVSVVTQFPAGIDRAVLEFVGSTASRSGVTVLQLGDGVPGAGFASAAIGVSIDCAAALAAGADPAALVGALGKRLGGLRLVDLTRSGMRGPILEPGESRLDALAMKVALDVAGADLLPVADARQWLDVRRGLLASVERWSALSA